MIKKDNVGYVISFWERVLQGETKPCKNDIEHTIWFLEDLQRLNGTIQPVIDARNKVRTEHAEWSQATFGNVGPAGPLKHLSKEALEAAAEPADLYEWADIQLLFWDAQRRAGITDEQITQAMIEKLSVNKAREWPEPKEGEPRLHIKTLSSELKS